MARWKYSAYLTQDPSNQVSDILEANTREDAVRVLMSRGLQPLSVEELTENSIGLNIEIIPDRVKPADLALFSRQLATLVGAGIPVLTAMDIAARGNKRKALRDAVDLARGDVNQGMPISQALARHPKVFPSLYVSLVRAGESGDLQISLNRLAEMLELQSRQAREVRGAMVYPLVVVAFAMTILIAMLIFVVPAFQDIFAQAGSGLPRPTQLLVASSNVVRKFWFLLPFVAAGAVMGFRYWKNTPEGRKYWGRFKLALPMGLGDLTAKSVTARFARTLATLQAAGVPLLQSLEIAAPTADNAIVEEAVHRAAQDVQNGRPLSAALREREVFPDLAMSMLESGERAGRMGDMLVKVADTYEEEVANAVKALKSVMEPVLMVGIGLFIGAIVVSLYLPMFSIYDKIK